MSRVAPCATVQVRDTFECAGALNNVDLLGCLSAHDLLAHSKLLLTCTNVLSAPVRRECASALRVSAPVRIYTRTAHSHTLSPGGTR